MLVRMLVMGVACLLCWTPGSEARAQTATQIVDQVNAFRFFTIRRHNDTHGAEGVFDDYRRAWLRRQTSHVRVGANGRASLSDTPICGDSDGYGSSAAGCGRRFTARAQVTPVYAEDSYNGANIEETGAVAYFGYEYLKSDDVFLGLGFSTAVSDITNNAGQGIQVDATDYAGHFIGGYQLNDDHMIAWNITYVYSSNDTTRNNTITGHFTTHTALVTGVWYTDVDLTETAYVSFGLDYTLQISTGDDYIESDGTVQSGVDEWQGDFTGSAMFVQGFEDAEAFARLGVSISTLNDVDRRVDIPVEVGGSIALTDTIALTGAIGGTILIPDFHELRGIARLTGRF